MPVFSAFQGTWRWRRPAFASGLFGLAGVLAVLGHAPPPPDRPGAWLALFVVGTGSSALALAAAPRAAPWLVLVSALVLRLLGLSGEPTLSDDRFRYVHEGRASRLGLAVPYSVPPRELTPPPDDGISARVNHPDVPAAYPPTSQLFFLVTVALGDAGGRPLAPLRAALVVFDLVILALLWRRREQDGGRSLTRYGLHPLPLLEVALGAHLDALGAALLALAVLGASRPLRQGLLVGLAMGVKPIAVLGLVGVTLRRRALAVALVGMALGVLGPTLPYLLAGAPLFSGLGEYGARWEAAPTGYALVEDVVGAPLSAAAAEGRWSHLVWATLDDGGTAWAVQTGGRTRLQTARSPLEADVDERRHLLLDHRLVGRLAAGGLLLLVVALLLAARLSPAGRVAWALAALWLLAPAVHPWYLLWLLPLAAAQRSTALWCWAASAPLAYEAALRLQAEGVWLESLWPRAVGLAALVAGALFDAWWARRGLAGASPALVRRPERQGFDDAATGEQEE